MEIFVEWIRTGAIAEFQEVSLVSMKTKGDIQMCELD